MNTKKSSKKLSLNKQTVARLVDSEMDSAHGGVLVVVPSGYILITTILKPSPDPWKPQPDPWQPMQPSIVF